MNLRHNSPHPPKLLLDHQRSDHANIKCSCATTHSRLKSGIIALHYFRHRFFVDILLRPGHVKQTTGSVVGITTI
jgi:hypothetical protein